MIHHTLTVIEVIAAVAALCGTAYYALCVLGGLRFLRRRISQQQIGPPQEIPSISILKPLSGLDPGMYESMRSYCLQDYPSYEIIFGVSDPNDPAVELVDYLRVQFPKRTIRLVICQGYAGHNPKVNNLVQMLPAARHDCLVVNDSDIRVDLDYLRRVVAPLANTRVGMVTCLYRGIAESTLGSRMEALGISTDFAGGVLVAHVMEGGLHFGLGSTLAFRRSVLEEVGGFEAFVNDLADDYELGKRIADQGFEVQLSDVIVETYLPPYTLRQFLAHQLRWARSTRQSRPWGYLGLILTFGWPWAALAVMAGHGVWWAWTLLAAAVIMRFASASFIGRVVLLDKQVVQYLGLTPIRDLVAMLVWIASFAGNSITWRGRAFSLAKGKLRRIAPRAHHLATSASKHAPLRRNSFFW